MSLDKIIVLVGGLFGLSFVYWFFLLKKDEEVVVSDSVDILVDGGYTPQVISIAKGQTTKLTFLRKDPNSCLEELVIPDFKVHTSLPLNKKVTIELTPRETGTFDYTCGMSMYRGRILVKG